MFSGDGVVDDRGLSTVVGMPDALNCLPHEVFHLQYEQRVTLKFCKQLFMS